ncbi:MAG: MBL fold metallo-hydrolase [Polyangiaceae bacterium]|nr:MBL fold metallo-hydrolase [Polyangiaceae bacterium]
MIVETFAVGALGCNCSIIVDPATKSAIVVDPGGNFGDIQARLTRLGAKVQAIVHTHTHIDHVGATAPLQSWTGANAIIHEDDRFLYDMLPIQAALVGTNLPDKCDLDGGLKDDLVLHAGGLQMHVLHTPGHTPGSCCFVAKLGAEQIAFAGDTLFRRSVGRTDLWGGDSDLLIQSIKHKLYSLEEGIEVVTGHGPSTTIGEERRLNPFVRI